MSSTAYKQTTRAVAEIAMYMPSSASGGGGGGGFGIDPHILVNADGVYQPSRVNLLTRVNSTTGTTQYEFPVATQNGEVAGIADTGLDAGNNNIAVSAPNGVSFQDATNPVQIHASPAVMQFSSSGVSQLWWWDNDDATWYLYP